MNQVSLCKSCVSKEQVFLQIFLELTRNMGVFCVFFFFFSGTQCNAAAGHRALPLTQFPLKGLGIEPE